MVGSLGFEGSRAGEFVLDSGDLAGYGRGARGGFVGGELGLLGRAEDPRGEQPVVGGGGVVVEVFVSPGVVGGPADGFLGGGRGSSIGHGPVLRAG